MMYITRRPDTRVQAAPPISTAEVKKQLNIEPEFTDDDSYIDNLIQTAVEIIEDDTHADFLDTVNTHTITLENSILENTIRIYAAPLRIFSKLEIENNDIFAEIPTTDYTIENGFHYFQIKLKTQQTGTRVRITYTTGYTASTYPKKLKQAAILKAADMYDTERSNYAQQVTDIRTYERLINSHIRKNW